MKLLPPALILVGLGIGGFALGSDLLGLGGQTGLGLRQAILALAGLSLVAAGAFLALPPGLRLTAEAFDPTAPARRPVGLLYTAVWFGLLTGLGEAAVLGVRKLLENQVINMSIHFPWMVPLGEVMLFFLPGLLLLILSRRWPLTTPRIPVFLFTFLGFLAWLFLYPRLHLAAVLLLAVGMSLQAARLAAAHPGGFYWLVRRTTPLLAALVIVLFASVYTWRLLSERRALADLPAVRPGARNVLLVVLDTVRAQNLSLYGYRRPTTPNLERLATRGMVFEKAVATAPWTLPSHGSMFTGRWHYEQSAELDQAFDSKFPTLAEVLGQQGYTTAGFVANTYYGSYEHGLQRGFAHYEDYIVSLEQIFMSGVLIRRAEAALDGILPQHRLYLPKTAARVNQDFFRWLSNRGNRPFFAFLNYMDAHTPYLPPAPYAELFGSQSRRINPKATPPWELSPEGVQAEVDAYDGAIAYLDEQVGVLMDELEARELLQDTLVIIVSDHGEQLGERNIFDHANSLYMQLLHVPLLILDPLAVPASETIQTPVSLRDLPATVFDLALGQSDSPFPGKSLARFWTDSGGPDVAEEQILSEMNWTPLSAREFPDWYPITKGDMKALLIPPYHYIHNGDASEELYDLRVDPAETINLVESTEARQALEGFRASLQSILPRAGQ